MIVTVRDHTFFARPLRAGRLALDLGAHRGEFMHEIVRRYGVGCIAVEPSRELAGAIAPPPGGRVRHLAVAARDGTMEFHVAENAEASSLFPANVNARVRTETVETRTLASLLEEEGADDVVLAKLDIEGAERDVLLETEPEVLTRIAQLTVEFHDFTGVVTEADIRAVVDRLDGLGFEAIRFSASHHNWLFFQPARCEVSRAETLAARHVVRNVRGAARRVGSLRSAR